MRKLCLAVAALLALITFGAAARSQDAPIMGSQSTEQVEQEVAAADETYRILVIGDALAGGVGAGLTRVTEADGQFEIANRFQEVSGLARPEVYDWAETLPKLMADKSFNSIVVLIGSNDRQEIRRDNFRFAFNTPDWRKSYQQNVDRLLAVLKDSGAKVFWLALPPMGDARYDADMQVLNAMHRERVESAGANFVDLRANFLAEDGSYASSGPDDTGTVRNLRDSDGIAFTKAGNTKFGRLVIEEIKRRIEGKTDLPLTTIADPPPIVAPDSAGPVFGGESQGGFAANSAPTTVDTSMASTVLTPVASATPVARSELARGSAAERLYVQGIADVAPVGRFDDYMLPKPAE